MVIFLYKCAFIKFKLVIGVLYDLSCQNVDKFSFDLFKLAYMLSTSKCCVIAYLPMRDKPATYCKYWLMVMSSSYEQVVGTI